MLVCVVGSGGREHALAQVLARTAEVVVTPGNPGIPNSTSSSPKEIDADLYVIGPEAPLVEGLADELRAMGKLVFGPGADGAQLEGSKAWMKDLLVEAGVPTARHGSFDNEADALAFLDEMSVPYVIKTDGLAAGKGVVVTDSLSDARKAVREYLSGAAFGDAGTTLVIEEGLVGPEVSILAVCDGTRAVCLEPAQDFKRALEGDLGPNTGGMGAYSPIPYGGPELLEMVNETFIEPTLRALNKRGIDYRGVLYAGLMLTEDGPKILEYNVRFGDPETQVVLPRITSDFAELLAQAAAGEIQDSPTFTSDAAVTVVVASENYPASPVVGDEISGIAEAEELDGVSVFCAGVKSSEDGLQTSGGRVLNVCGIGPSLKEARESAYRGVGKVSWRGMQFRTDIAKDAVSEFEKIDSQKEQV